MSLRDYIERAMSDQNALIAEQFKSAQVALDKAENALSLKLSSVGKDLESINHRISKLENDYANLQGRIWGVGVIVTIINVAVDVGWLILHKP